ncbi:MFS transporter [Bifidobacterium simiarum]|nr:MFS transporter [Bifidobacterium simiarum]MBT1166343.1 MFS transporter [Bifidobacterium simiarum]
MSESQTTVSQTTAQTVQDPDDDYDRIVSEYGNPKRTIALVLIAAIGMYIMCMSLSTCLSLRIAAIAPDQKNDFYSRIVAIGSFTMLFGQPIIGALSDRTTSRLGRRKPWIIGCLLISVAALAVSGISDNMVVLGAAYVIGVLMMQCGFSIYSVIPVEGVPNRYRARVMGFMGMFGALATSFGSYLAGALVRHPLILMTMPVLLGLITSIPLFVLYKDPVKTKDEVPPLDLKETFSGMIVNPRQHPNYLWVWITRCLTGFTIAAMFSYFTYYMIDGLGVPLDDVGAKAGLLTLLSAPVSILFFTMSGVISDKIGRRKPLVIFAGLCMAAALVLGGTSHSFIQFIIAWELFAVGQAMYLTVDLALCASVLPDQKDAGKDMAMFSVALSIGQMLAPALAPFFINIGASPNYLLFWCVAAVAALVAAAMMPLVKGVK